jgi:AbrB family looped-hinge helix DNA binding protein
MATARVTSKGQITVPKQVRDRLDIQPGDGLEFFFEGDRLEVRHVPRRRLAEFRGRFPVSNPLSFAEERARAGAARAERFQTNGQASNA